MSCCDELRRTHDLSLSDWGPYARDFYGLSRIADRDLGIRLDFFMAPGILRRAFFPPEPLRECGCSPWEAAPDLRYFMFRQQMEGRNLFYTDTAYAEIDRDLWLGRIEFVNSTDEPRANSLLHYTRLAPPRDQVIPRLGPGMRWFGALDYAELHYSYPRHDHDLTFNAGRRGEQIYPGAVANRCLGQPFYNRTAPCFGARKGDTVLWRFEADPGEAEIRLRIRAKAGETVSLETQVNEARHACSVTGTGRFELVSVHCGKLSGTTEFRLTSLSDGSGFRIDGFVVTTGTGRSGEAHFIPLGQSVVPAAVQGAIPDCTVLTADGLSGAYAVWRSASAVTEREYRVRSLPELIQYSYGLRQPYWQPPSDDHGEYCRDAYIIPIEVPARGSKVIYTLYSMAETSEAAEMRIARYDRTPEALEKAFLAARKRAVSFPEGPGETFRFSQKLMAAASLTNINFPIRMRETNIRHHVPDKYFSSLYSWDSGFIGLGLLELDKQRAIENLNAYVTGEDDENAFVLHGTPLPVQAYLYAEIWNRHQDRGMLEYFYPRLRRFYDFITGHVAGSTFASAKTGLLRSWDYFYNSGGWDDYPPQWYVYKNKRYDVAPVVTTAHALRFARILRQAARTLGYDRDFAGYDADIERLGTALQRYSYDPEEKLFGYVEHDEQGNFAGLFRDPASGRNFNLGMDGLTPLLSGICTPEQEEAMFTRLTDPDAMWTPVGLSTVDRRAPYFRTDGYWNGGVWMPHQWFFWKSALDAGRGVFARQIAETALNVWKNEVDRSFYCFEHFSISSGRGAGCCHFGGLSSPVLNWYGAYFRPGRLTGGFDCWITRQTSLPEGGSSAELILEGRSGDHAVMLFAAPDSRAYRAFYRGEPVPCERSLGNAWEITLPKQSSGTLRLE